MYFAGELRVGPLVGFFGFAESDRHRRALQPASGPRPGEPGMRKNNPSQRDVGLCRDLSYLAKGGDGAKSEAAT
jgi:hypothetical protein